MSDQPTNTLIARTQEDYHSIADYYDKSFEVIPYRVPVEEYSIVQAIEAVGGVAGQVVLDVASGTGHYTRLLRQLGAVRVVGVDFSSEMIRVAQEIENAAPLGGITYEMQDVGELDLPETFDLALGVYLLHYATTQTHLQQICQGIARHVRPGGHFVTFLPHPDFSTDPEFYKKYGLMMDFSSPRRDGDAGSLFLQTHDSWTHAIAIYYWSRSAVEAALQQAGFADIQWHTPRLSATGREQYGAEFWQDCLDYPPCALVTATKQ
jgi:SAM-dependent methyltransferase